MRFSLRRILVITVLTAAVYFIIGVAAYMRELSVPPWRLFSGLNQVSRLMPWRPPPATTLGLGARISPAAIDQWAIERGKGYEAKVAAYLEQERLRTLVTEAIEGWALDNASPLSARAWPVPDVKFPTPDFWDTYTPPEAREAPRS
jgi:hypothetical protein